MYFAHNSIYIAIVKMLHVFKITKTRDEFGNEVIPEVMYDGFIRYVETLIMILLIRKLKSARIVSHPRPFRCSIEPRSPAARDLVMQNVQED